MEQSQQQVLGDPRKDAWYAQHDQRSKNNWHRSQILTLLLGIVGYGHIGSQLSVLAEAMGMNVIYYDVVNLMALGTAKQVPTLEALLNTADFVTLHVPELPETKNMISAAQFDQMKQGSYLINASRGTVVDIPALINASRSGKIAGSALDVYPGEPGANGDYFTNDLNGWEEDLRSLQNIILTPHIGGSTEEAQRAIGVEGESQCCARLHYITTGLTSLASYSCRCSCEIYQPGLHACQCQYARVQPPFPDVGRVPACSRYLHPQERAGCAA